jgi:hypothetical protein
MLFEHEGRWWMLTNIASPGNEDYNSQLMAFYADSPFADSWTAHPQNPLAFDSDLGRNGGLLRFAGGLPVRARQRQGFDEYGVGLSLARITDLTPTTYREEPIGAITPDFFPNLRGCHHIYSDGQMTVYDFARFERAR